MKALAKKEREQIFNLFERHFQLKFSEIEKQLRIRSNMLAYYLEQMVKEGVLQKDGATYALTHQGEQFLPHASRELGPLPVILVAPMRNGKVFLVQRQKRPYKGYWGMLGGKIRFGETLEECCQRKLKEESLDGTMAALHCVAHEKVEEEGKAKHSFLLFFVTATVQNESSKGQWFDLKKLEAKTIPSDLWLLQEKSKERIQVPHIVMQDKAGELSGFKVH